jgi:lactate permease
LTIDYMNIIKTILAFIPIIWMIVSLTKLKLPAYKAGAWALITALVIAAAAFGMKPVHAAQATAEGIMMAIFPILWVILTALFVYNVTLETGSMEKIKEMLLGISPDRRIQALILAFSFGGFLEAVAGFGTSVAIPAGILASMGFNPFLAASVCLIANTVSVAFGVLGIPIITLSQVTDLSLGTLSLYTALQLFPFAVLLPFLLVFAVTGSFKKVKGVAGISFAAGFTFAAVQTLTVVFIGPELAAVAGSIFSLAVLILWSRLRPIREVWLFEGEYIRNDPGLRKDIGSPEMRESKIGLAGALTAWAPYILILVIILMTRFLPFFDFLDEFPFTVERQFYFGEGGKPVTFQLAASGGTALFISAFIGGLMQGASLKKLFGVFIKTLKQIGKTTVTVICVVSLAKVMGYSGMISSIANMLAAASGRLYPFLAPVIGALGTFITGSDTSSNVLFGSLQKQTAIRIGSGQEWLTAANASGATAGKMVSPQSIAIATAAAGQSGSEGRLMITTVKYCLIYVLAMGTIVLLFSI